MESTKLALNRADLRARNLEALSTDLSEFAFNAELVQEFIQNNWTRRESLEALLPDYNASITKVRKNEFVYSAWLAQYWDQQQLSRFDAIMGSIRAFDQSVHSLNTEFEAINYEKSKVRIEPALASAAAAMMKPQVHSLQKDIRLLLTDLR